MQGLFSDEAGLLALGAALGGVATWLVCLALGRRAGRRRRELALSEDAVALRLRELERVKADLIAVVSHEFRTPLTSLSGYARTLATRMDQLSPDAVRRCVDGIDEHATALARLVHNVLAAEGDVARHPCADTDLAHTARAVASDLRRTQPCAPVIALHLPGPLRARIDAGTAYRVLYNLLDNASKFGVGGAPVEVRGCAGDGVVGLEISNVIDGGDRLDMATLFEPFRQHDSSTTRARGGLGLGLHVARRLVVAHGGRLEADCERRRVTMRLELPAVAAAPSGDVMGAHRRPEPVGAPAVIELPAPEPAPVGVVTADPPPARVVPKGPQPAMWSK